MMTADREPAAVLKQRIDSREARISIVGMGYVGLPLALLFSGQRFRVTGFESSRPRSIPSNAGALTSGAFSPARFRRATGWLSRHVGFRRDRPDGRNPHLCAHSLKRHQEPDPQLRDRNGRIHRSLLREGQLGCSRKHHLSRHHEEIVRPPAYGPESARDSRSPARSTSPEFTSPSRLSARDPATTPSHGRDIPKVLGGCGPAATELASALYGAIFRRVVPVSSPAVAEMTKLLETSTAASTSPW